MKTVPEDISVYALSKECPKTKGIMTKLGFKDIVKPDMSITVGRMMTLKKDCKVKPVDYEKAKDAFLEVDIRFESKS